MTEFLTTRELASLLRVKERKVYDLVAQEKLPVRRVTGKLLFPRDEIETWIRSKSGDVESATRVSQLQPRVVPSIIVGGA